MTPVPRAGRGGAGVGSRVSTSSPDGPDVSVGALSRSPAVLRLHPALTGPAVWLMSHWPGRIALRSAAAVVRIEVIDRSMTVAAQFFTSVFPILIMSAAWLGKRQSDQLAAAVGMPEASRDVLDQALGPDGLGAFGIAGAFVVLISATSLSRALTRAFASIWSLPRGHGALSDAWRWLAAVLAAAVGLVSARALTRLVEPLPPPEVWALSVAFLLDIAVAVFIPRLLLPGQVSTRLLVPGLCSSRC